ncbi:hypothetical protein FOXYSP1_20771 [Fusarium oxysporum f. sp. phaseoli]
MARSFALWFNGLCNRYMIIAVSRWPEGQGFDSPLQPLV